MDSHNQTFVSNPLHPKFFQFHFMDSCTRRDNFNDTLLDSFNSISWILSSFSSSSSSSSSFQFHFMDSKQWRSKITHRGKKILSIPFHGFANMEVLNVARLCLLSIPFHGFQAFYPTLSIMDFY